MASVTITKHTMSSASSGQINHCYRTHEQYANKDIDLSRTGENLFLGCDTAQEARSRLRGRIREVDEVLPPKVVRQNRVVCVEYELPAPRENMPVEEQVRFLQQAYGALERKFGADNIICGTIHLDEIHDYEDGTGKHTSRAHLHVLGVPYVEGKGINGKEFLKRETYNEVNKAMDEVCKTMYGYSFRDGTRQKSKGTVEQLKQGEKNVKAYEVQMKSRIDQKARGYVKQLDAEISRYKASEMEKAQQDVSDRKNALKAEIRGLRGKLEQQNMLYQQRAGELENLSQTLQNARKDVLSLKDDVNTLQSRKDALKGEIELLSSQKDEIMGKIQQNKEIYLQNEKNIAKRYEIIEERLLDSQEKLDTYESFFREISEDYEVSDLLERMDEIKASIAKKKGNGENDSQDGENGSRG